MQNHQVISPEYTETLEHFKEWLKVLGYAPVSVRSLPGMLREFFNYLESQDITSLVEIEKAHIESYIEYLKVRKNTRREGALSIIYINGHIGLLHNFSNYIEQTRQLKIPVTVMRYKEETKTDHIILSIEEIKQLYDTTDETPYGLRDRAMLAVYYGCALRKSEGVNLELSDLLFDRRLLYIRKTKNNHERYVPVTAGNLKTLEQYVYNARPLLLGEQSKETALFVSERGTRIHKHMQYLRIKQLAQKAGITKAIGLHTLRHSIATHLLQKGMELENIALLLGHRSLDSTQIYTHIVNENTYEY